MAREREAVDNLLDALVWMRRKAKKKAGKKRKKQPAKR
jgi:hypothetical protein